MSIRDNLPDEYFLGLAQKDIDAIEAIYNKYYPRIFHFLQRRVWPHTALALDLTSETFLKMIEASGQYSHENESKFSSWLFTIAYNNLKLHFRKQKRMHYLDNAQLEMLRGDAVPDVEIQAIAAEYHQNQLFQEVSRVISDLPLDRQVLIDLKYFEGKTYEEMEEITGVKQGTIKSRLSRVISKVAEIMERNVD